MNRTTALRLALLLPLALGSTSCAVLNQLFQKPNVTVRSVDLTSLSFAGIGVNFVLNVDNPNPLGIDLARFAYQLTIEGRQLAAGQANQAVSVPAAGSGTINLPVSIRFLDFVASLETLFTKQNVAYSIAMSPGFNTPLGIIDIPLSHDGTLPVPQLPSVSLGTPTLGPIDLTGASVNIPISIANKNAFPLPVNSLNYAITVGGSPLVSASATPGAIAANQSTLIPVNARIDFLKAGLGVAQALHGGGANLALAGALDMEGYKLPLNLTTRLGR